MEYEVILTIMLFIAFTIFGRVTYKNYFNPISLMCGMWAVILIAYSFHGYDLYYASGQSIQLIAIGISMFFIGGALASIRNTGYRTYAHIQINNYSITPNYHLLVFFNLISIVILSVSFVSTIQLLRNGIGFNFIAKYYGTDEGTLGTVQRGYELTEFIVWPLTLATSPIAVVSLFCDKNKTIIRRLFLCTFLINTVMFIVVTGKRLNLVLIIIYSVILFRLLNKHINIRFRTKILILLLIFTVVFAFNYISVSRGSESIFRTIYIYLCGCIPCLSEKLNDIPVDYQYGLLSFHGLYRAPGMILNILIKSPTFLDIRSMVATVIEYTQETVRISPTSTYNAFVTPFFYFYTDLGMVGVIIFSCIFGYFCTSIYNKMLHKRSYKYLIIYLLLTYSIFMSMVRFQFVQMRYALSFFYVLIAFVFRFNVNFRVKTGSVK